MLCARCLQPANSGWMPAIQILTIVLVFAHSLLHLLFGPLIHLRLFRGVPQQLHISSLDSHPQLHSESAQIHHPVFAFELTELLQQKPEEAGVELANLRGKYESG